MPENIGSQKQSQDPFIHMKPVQNPPHILALVIGINAYPGGSSEYNNLTGAVGDADAFEVFLRTRLQVPEKNICSLRDERASREGILNGFRFLRDNQTYEKDDVEIIIYYAGHGAQESIPADWEDWYTPTGRIEMLCPSDIGTRKSEGKGMASVVSGIPDRTISGLLNQISSRKSSHITVILDCCSSAGMNRGGTGGERYIARQMNDPPSLMNSVDHHIWKESEIGTRSSHDTKGYSGRFRASHVLLAACGREQLAWEDPKSKRGLFTYNLLKILMSNEMETLTYRSLMDKLTMPKNQTPHCEGEGMNRLLFGNKGSGADTAFIYANRALDGKITLEAGSAQGITVGSRFSVHKMDLLDSRFLPNPSLGYLVVISVNVFSSTLEPLLQSSQFRPPRRFYCKAVDGVPRSISLYSKEKDWLESMFHSDNQQIPLFNIVDSPAECNLELVIEGDTVYFDRCNDIVIPHIGSRLHHTVNKNDPITLRKVLNAARHFNYHLKRTAPDDAGDVRMEVRELEAEEFDNYSDFRPIGENLLAEEPATITVDGDSCFGINVINNSDRVLYPYLFYFDPSDFTITEIYAPPLGAGHGRLISNIEIEQPFSSSSISTTAVLQANNSDSQITTPIDKPNLFPECNRLKIGVDAALPPKAHLTIGYGNGGSKPWQFVIPNGQSKDVGFLRLFLCTRPANFQNIIQQSPFEASRSSAVVPPMREVEDVERWMVKTATIVQVPV